MLTPQWKRPQASEQGVSLSRLVSAKLAAT